MKTEWSQAPYPSGPTGNNSTFARRYMDASGRPMSGKVVITGSVWVMVGDDVIPPSPVPVELDSSGTVNVILPHGVYDVSERLSSPEGQQLNREWRLTLP